ncbi:MAG: hypothetical protein ACD_75C00540G0005 [uncultured bacterium]|nr:MAG: hypothetical protein ACD_75C00540G0005 [uncultured bacterium]
MLYEERIHFPNFGVLDGSVELEQEEQETPKFRPSSEREYAAIDRLAKMFEQARLNSSTKGE